MSEAHSDAPKRDVRLPPIMVSPGEIEAIQDFRYGARIPSMAETLRRLIRMGLASRGAPNRG